MKSFLKLKDVCLALDDISAVAIATVYMPTENEDTVSFPTINIYFGNNSTVRPLQITYDTEEERNYYYFKILEYLNITIVCDDYVQTTEGK